MNLGLKGKVALVSGASQGMGRAIALGFAREGAKLAICARGEAILKEAAESIRRETGGEVLDITADMSRPEDIKKFVAEGAGRFGRVDVLVTNAGGPPPGEFMKFTDQVINRGLWTIYKTVPNFNVFSLTPYVANGFDVPFDAGLLPALAMTLAYLFPCLFIGYFSLRLRELEAK